MRPALHHLEEAQNDHTTAGLTADGGLGAENTPVTRAKAKPWKGCASLTEEDKALGNGGGRA